MAINEKMMEYILEHLDEILDDERVRMYIAHRNIEGPPSIEEYEEQKRYWERLAGEEEREKEEEVYIKEQPKYYLYFEDLVGNLFYTFKMNLISDNKVSYSLIEKYGEIIKEEASKDKIEINIVPSKENHQQFFDKYSDFYKETEDNNGIVLIKDITIFKLSNIHNINNLPIDESVVLSKTEVTSRLIEAYEEEKNVKINIKRRND